MPSVREAFLDFARRALAEEAPGRIAWAFFDFVRDLLKSRKSRGAVLGDDVFEVIGLGQAAAYVKGLLNMIEHPPYDYESIVVLVATSEGLSRREIGRHLSKSCHVEHAREGLRGAVRADTGPQARPRRGVEADGGNPRALSMLYEAG